MRTFARGAVLLLAWLVMSTSLRAETPYLAFSLTAASRLDNLPAQMDAITSITGMVYDAERGEIIIVGQAGDGDPIPIGDLMVALRARLQFGKYPLVSIDRTRDTARTRRQKIRFDGGLENTDYGDKLLQADVRLKMLALGLSDPDTSYFAMTASDVRRGTNAGAGSALLWFYPSGGELIEREDVFAIRSISIGVKTQTTAGAPDVVADRFARQTTEQFEALANQYPEIARLRTLYALVALATAMEKHPEAAANIAARYPIPQHATPAEYELVTRSEKIGQHNLVISGGIRLAVRSLRLREGDVSALREAVLESRPSPEAVSWKLPLDDWLLPDSASDVLTLPVDGDDPGTHIARRVEIVPDLLIYRGAIRGNQVLTDPRRGVAGSSTGDARGGVSAGVQVHDEDFAKPANAEGTARKEETKKEDTKRERTR